MMHLMATPTDQRVADLVREAAGEGAARINDARIRRLAEDITEFIALLPREETSGVVYDKLIDALTCLLDARAGSIITSYTPATGTAPTPREDSTEEWN